MARAGNNGARDTVAGAWLKRIRKLERYEKNPRPLRVFSILASADWLFQCRHFGPATPFFWVKTYDSYRLCFERAWYSAECSRYTIDLVFCVNFDGWSGTATEEDVDAWWQEELARKEALAIAGALESSKVEKPGDLVHNGETRKTEKRRRSL